MPGQGPTQMSKVVPNGMGVIIVNVWDVYPASTHMSLHFLASNGLAVVDTHVDESNGTTGSTPLENPRVTTQPTTILVSQSCPRRCTIATMDTIRVGPSKQRCSIICPGGDARKGLGGQTLCVGVMTV